MRDEIGIASAISLGVDSPMELPLPTWEALPLPVRLQHHLAEILVLVDELRTELCEHDSAWLRWLDVEMERIGEKVEILLDRLSC